MILLWLESEIFEANKVNDPYTRITIFGQTFAANVVIFIFKRTTRRERNLNKLPDIYL